MTTAAILFNIFCQTEMIPLIKRKNFSHLQKFAFFYFYITLYDCVIDPANSSRVYLFR